MRTFITNTAAFIEWRNNNYYKSGDMYVPIGSPNNFPVKFTNDQLHIIYNNYGNYFYLLVTTYGKGYGKTYIARSNTKNPQTWIELAREFKQTKFDDEIICEHITRDEFQMFKGEGLPYLGFLRKPI